MLLLMATPTTFTLELLKQAMEMLIKNDSHHPVLQKVAIGMGPNGPIDRYEGRIGHLKVIVTADSVMESDERLFPDSKHRSSRIKKKLIKRFGGEFKKVPAIWQTDDRIYMHPAKWIEYQQLKLGK